MALRMCPAGPRCYVGMVIKGLACLVQSKGCKGEQAERGVSPQKRLTGGERARQRVTENGDGGATLQTILRPFQLLEYTWPKWM